MRLELKDYVHIVFYLTVIIKINKYLSCSFKMINKLLKAKRWGKVKTYQKSLSHLYEITVV